MLERCSYCRYLVMPVWRYCAYCGRPTDGSMSEAASVVRIEVPVDAEPPRRRVPAVAAGALKIAKRLQATWPLQLDPPPADSARPASPAAAPEAVPAPHVEPPPTKHARPTLEEADPPPRLDGLPPAIDGAAAALDRPHTTTPSLLHIAGQYLAELSRRAPRRQPQTALGVIGAILLAVFAMALLVNTVAGGRGRLDAAPPDFAALAGFGGGLAPAPPGASIAGTWVITAGQATDEGELVQYRVRIEQDAAHISGGGDGLSLSGQISGMEVAAFYDMDGNNGTFAWELSEDAEMMRGTFSTKDGDSGESVAVRVE